MFVRLYTNRSGHDFPRWRLCCMCRAWRPMLLIGLAVSIFDIFTSLELCRGFLWVLGFKFEFFGDGEDLEWPPKRVAV